MSNATPVLLPESLSISLFEGQQIGNLIRFRDGNDAWTVTASYSDGAEENSTVVADPTDPFGATRIAQLTHAFANEGNYTIDLTIDDTVDGVSQNFTINVTVANEVPVYVGGIMRPTNEIEGTDAFFSIAATDVPADTVTFEWDFEYDGLTFTPSTTGDTVTYQFPDDGTYTVAVRATDGVDTAEILTIPISRSERGSVN